jgi:hypothetical protein
LYHPEYLPILFELNIDDTKKQDFIINNIVSKDLIILINKLNSFNDI